MPPSTPLAERLVSKLAVPPMGFGCWEWTGATTGAGYGSIAAGAPSRKLVRVHRAAYEVFTGPIPEGAEVDHRCRNRRCANPAHLEAVSHAENSRRGFARGRNLGGRRAGVPSPNAGVMPAARTHCPHGHVYDEANTYVQPDGGRACRACRNRQSKEWRQANLNLGLPSAAKTHCPKGHPYDEANTYLIPNGHRLCLQCKRAASRSYRDRQRLLNSKVGGSNSGT